MSATQRARSAVPLDTRSLIPTVPGVPWWGALAIAGGATAVGVLLDGVRGNELTSAFTVFYVLGCIAAVVAVRHRGLFTAMAQPPLLLIASVPIGQELIASGSTSGLKDLALNVAYPLVNRFPAMLFATVVVVLIGGYRIFVAQQSAGVRARAPRARAPRSRAAKAAAGRRVAEKPSATNGRARATTRSSGSAQPRPTARKPSARETAAPTSSARATAVPTASVRDVADTRGNPVSRRRPAAASNGTGAAEPAARREPRRAPQRDVPSADERAPRRRVPAQESRRAEPRPAAPPQPTPAPAYPPPRVRYRDRYED